MVAHVHLPKNPQTEDDRQQWQEWVAAASPGELFEAFITRLSHSRVTQPDLEPVQSLLASTLREHLQGGNA